MKKIILINTLLIILINNVLSQNILRGTVKNEANETLIGAVVKWETSNDGVVTDENGHFEIKAAKETKNLIISFVGYQPMMVEITPEENDIVIQVTGMTILNEVSVTARQRDNNISTLDPRRMETISSRELMKAPCCNLSESFETNGSIDVSYSDGVTGAKEIQMLGLRGIYSQMLLENRPDLSGLSTPYALEYIPGTWLESIQIAKGAGSVQNGYQSITGQVNAELVKPYRDKKFFINLYAEAIGRTELNIHLNKVLKNGWSHGVLLHGDHFNNSLDRNNDYFYDTPLKKQLNGLYRLFYEGTRWCGQFNLHGIHENRVGGQTDKAPVPSGIKYVIEQQAQRVAVWTKIGFKGFAQEYNALGSQANFLWYQNQGRFGQRDYKGEQRSAYLNVMYNTIINTTDHKLSLGTSFQYDSYRESVDTKQLERTEIVPGTYSEYTYNRPALAGGYNDITVVAGLRADYNSYFGFFLTPRLNIKYNFNENTVVRALVGRGLRSANVFAENLGILATNRYLDLQEDLRMEDAWNTGLNYTQNFKIAAKDASFAVDLYHTKFQNQVIIDMDHDPQMVLIYNLRGASFSNNFLVTGTFEPFLGFEIKMAYKYNDVRITYSHGLEQQPLVPRHRGLVACTYETPNKKWMFNASTQLVGEQRLPLHNQLPEDIYNKLVHTAPNYALLNAQATWLPNKKWSIYIGGENLADYTQRNPIIAADNPFSPYFDTSQVYAPVVGRRLYAGMRYGF